MDPAAFPAGPQERDRETLAVSQIRVVGCRSSLSLTVCPSLSVDDLITVFEAMDASVTDSATSPASNTADSSTSASTATSTATSSSSSSDALPTAAKEFKCRAAPSLRGKTWTCRVVPYTGWTIALPPNEIAALWPDGPAPGFLIGRTNVWGLQKWEDLRVELRREDSDTWVERVLTERTRKTAVDWFVARRAKDAKAGRPWTDGGCAE